MKKYLLTFLIVPAFVHAQSLMQALVSIRGIVRQMPKVLFGLSIAYFFWGGVQFIQNAGDAKTRVDAKNKMIWGLVALFVFVSIFGILNALRDVIGL